MRSTAEIAVPCRHPRNGRHVDGDEHPPDGRDLSGRDVDESFDSALSNAESLIANMQ